LSLTETSKKFDSVSLYRIRKLLSDLSNKTGRGTELVSLYLPPKKPVHEAIAALREESGTASNIKSDTTRNHVQDALTKTMARLRLYKQTPENGIVIFCGAIPGPGGPGNETIELYEVLPQKPVTVYLYRCDDHFHLDPLREMLREQNVIGILALDATEAGLGVVSGDSWEVVDTMSSGVSGKTKKGGQCVSSDTLIQLQDGRLVEISKLTQGSRIASYDFTNYSSGFHECADTFSMVPASFYEIRTIRPQLTVRATAEHRFFTLDRGNGGVTTKQAFELRKGDRVLVSRKLPEPREPTLETNFPKIFRHAVSEKGRQKLRNLRLERGLSQKDLAEAFGLHQAEVSQLERGKRALVWERLQKIITFLTNDPTDFNAEFLSTTLVLPEFFTPELLQLMGYITGDGCAGGNRISLYEQRREVAEIYSDIIKKSIYLDYVPIFARDQRKKKGAWSKNIYFETRIYSKVFLDAISQLYPGILSSKLREIPAQIHRLDNAQLAAFLRGLFDAEGRVRKTRLGIAMRSGTVIRQLRLLLLRFGIVSSYSRYSNRFGTRMYSLDISDLDSIVRFEKQIGFSASDKSHILAIAAKRKRSHSSLNVPVLGSWIDACAKESQIRRRQFEGITNFFHDQRGISAQVFQRILRTFENEVSVADNPEKGTARTQLVQETLSRLSMIANSELVIAYVADIQQKDNSLKEEFLDIELPATRSFIGDGFVLHNSARRYERLREMELTEYFTRVAEHAKAAFLEQYQVKGLIVSGPGPTKDEFVKDKYLDYRLQNIIVGTLDSGYTGREGVRETIEKAGKLLENVRVVEEKKLAQRFLGEVNSDSGLAAYGINDVLGALKKAAVDTIIVNDDIDMVFERATCKKCGNITEKFIQRTDIVSEKQDMLVCPKCGSNEIEFYERDIVDYLADVAVESGANVEVISSKTEDGAMMKNFGGISALLRYRA
jgi:peptide subunit release factor 1 (eRF1)/intein/homing endonuclease